MGTTPRKDLGTTTPVEEEEEEAVGVGAVAVVATTTTREGVATKIADEEATRTTGVEEMMASTTAKAVVSTIAMASKEDGTTLGQIGVVTEVDKSKGRGERL